MPTTRSALKQQEREYHNSHQHVNELPPEILSQIFVLCNHRRFSTSDDNWEGFACRGRIPAVCRQWRKVALDTTVLWTRVRLSGPVSYHRSALYLSRSGSVAPLDIEIDMKGVFEARRMGGTLEERTQRVKDALDFIINHGGATSRWRSFWIQTSVYCAYLAVADLLQSSPMPSLQRLEMVFLGPAEFEGDWIPFYDAVDSPSPKLLLHNPPPPQLRTVRLERIPNAYLFGHPDHPQLVGLTHLELEFVERHPNLGDLHKVVAACPNLVSFWLDSGSTDEPFHAPPVTTPSEHLSRIYLPELRALSLSHITSPEWDIGVLAMLDAPKLEVLRVAFEFYLQRGEYYPQIIDLLTRGIDKENPKPYFPSLTRLSYDIATDPTEDLQLLLTVYPGITSLSLPSGPPLTALFNKPWLAPNLKRLRTPMGPDLKKLVAARHKAGLPLKIVEINQQWLGPDTKPRDKKQIEKWVDSVIVTGYVDERTLLDPMSW